MAMLRLPTFISFPFIIWNRQKALDEDEENVASLLLPEETLIKHHGSILNYSTDEVAVFAPESVRSNFFSLLQENDIKHELVAIVRYSIPLMLTFLVSMSNRVIDIWFLGKLGPEAMAVVSLANLFTTVAGVSVGMGLLTAIDTLVAQAFTGASNPFTIGLILQRGLIIMFIVGTMIALLWTRAESILLYLGQTPELAHMAQSFITLFTPSMFILFFVVALRKFLQGLGQMKVTMYLVFVMFPVNVVLDYFFFVYMDLGYISAAYQSVSGLLITTLAYLVFIFCFTDARKYWPGFTPRAFDQWGIFLKLGIPGMLSVSTDWAFEVCGILAGALGQTSLAAQSVVLIVNTLLLMIPSAIASALIVRLGHHLGANQPEKTILCVMISTFLGFLTISLNTILMYTNRVKIAHLFSTDEAVILAIEELMGVGSLSQFVIGFGIVLSGTLNALGKQHIVAGFNIISYYCIGLPFGLYMTYYHNWGIVGIWSGVVLSGVIKSLSEAATLLFFIDWQQECLHAAKRINKQEI